MPSKNCRLLQQLTGIDRDDIQAFASRRVGIQDADDLVQDAYLHLLQRDEAEDVREPRAFLFRMIANLSVDAWRKKQRCAETKAEDDDVNLDSVASRLPGPDAQLAGKLAYAEFLGLLDELPLLTRHAFVLNKIEGMTHLEIAARLGVSTKSVQRYLLEAMAHFAGRLDGGPR